VIDIQHLGMQLDAGGHIVTILEDISLRIPEKQVLALVGPSGSGKSTLLGLIAGLDRPTSGSIHLAGRDITALDESEMARYRRRTIGYIFQSFHLIPTLTALENISVPLELDGAAQVTQRAAGLLADVGLVHRGGALSRATVGWRTAAGRPGQGVCVTSTHSAGG